MLCWVIKHNISLLSKGTGEKCAEGCQTCRQAILLYSISMLKHLKYMKIIFKKITKKAGKKTYKLGKWF